MLAIGCLFPFLMLLGGALAGGAIGGARESLIGAILGFVVGVAIPASAFWGFTRMNRPSSSDAKTKSGETTEE